MSWRLLAASGALLICLVVPELVRAQESASGAKGKAESATAGSADQASSPDETAPATKTSTAKPAAVKGKAASSKAKSKKSAGRTDSSASSSSSGSEPKYELATFGGGCFWHVESDFERLSGVVSAVSGYAGGQLRNPTYDMVHEGFTGHAEVVMVQYDPAVVSYEDLLKVFWQCHDPTTPNRQGPDVGTQYRSIILYHNEAQRKAALKSYQQLVEARAFRNPIVTQLFPLRTFYRAEDEHQDYYGGKPKASSRRKSTSSARSKKPLSKVAKALATDLADEPKAGEKAKPVDGAKPGEEAKPADEKPAATGPASEKAGESKP